MSLAPPPNQSSFIPRILALLEAEPGLRGSPERPALLQAVTDLEDEAFAAGADERTMKLIRSARHIVDFGLLLPPTMVDVPA